MAPVGHQPVLAGAPCTLYRLRKLGRRHRVGRHAEAGDLYRLAIDLTTGVFGPWHSWLVRASGDCARLLREQQRTAEELETRARSLER